LAETSNPIETQSQASALSVGMVGGIRFYWLPGEHTTSIGCWSMTCKDFF